MTLRETAHPRTGNGGGRSGVAQCVVRANPYRDLVHEQDQALRRSGQDRLPIGGRVHRLRAIPGVAQLICQTLAAFIVLAIRLCQWQRQRQMKIITGSPKVVQGAGETQTTTVLL